MKAHRLNQGSVVRIGGFLTVQVICLATLSAFGQSLIIEGGPNGARISNRDGKVEGPASSSNRQNITAVQNSSTPIGEGLRAISPVRFLDNTFPQPPSQQPETSFPVPNTEPGKPTPPRVIDVKKQIHLNNMERKLGIQKSSAYAGLTYDADLLFEPGPAIVSDLVKPILDELSGYLSIAEGKSISVTYRYKLNEDSAENGTARAQALVNYLSEKSGITKDKFTVPVPQPSTHPVVKDGAFSGELRPDYKSLLTVIVHRH